MKNRLISICLYLFCSIYSSYANQDIKVLTYDASIAEIDTCATCKNDLIDSGWVLVRIDNRKHFFKSIKKSIGEKNKISILEIVAHSGPGVMGDYFNLNNICEFGKRLNKFIDSNTVIYLSGCNTAIKTDGFIDCLNMSTTERLANITNCKEVFGSLGYLSGTYAQKNEKCCSCSSCVCDGINAINNEAWQSSKKSIDDCKCSYIIHYDNLKSFNFDIYKELLSEVNKINTPEFELRPLADFSIKISNSEKLDVYLLENIIYNRKTQKLYKFNKDEFLSKIQFIISNTQK